MCCNFPSFLSCRMIGGIKKAIFIVIKRFYQYMINFKCSKFNIIIAKKSVQNIL